jgi:peptidase E
VTAADGRRRILAIGGFAGDWAEQDTPRLVRHAVELAGKPEPRACLIATATGDDPGGVLRAYSWLHAAGARPSHLALFPMPNVPEPAKLLLSQDVIFVGGGSVANLAAVWRAHGLAEILRQAWADGIVLAGVSAGALCWFEGGTTDSFGPRLRPFTAGFGFLGGSYCPHYSSEPGRKPLYEHLVGAGTLAPGIACDDGTAALFTDGELDTIVTEQQGRHGYRVAPDGGGGVSTSVLPERLLPA